MFEWWNSLTVIQQILSYVAIPATLVLILQTILILIGLGNDGAGIDTSDTSGLDLDMGDVSDIGDISDMGEVGSYDGGDNSVGFDDGSAVGDFAAMRIFTLQGIVAFLAIFGWSAIAMISGGVNPLISILLGLVLGFFAMIGVGKIIQLSSRLSHNGTFVIKNLLGASGTVYLQIPPKGKGQGKVNITLQERYLEYMAVTESGQPLNTGAEIRVVDIRGDILVVEPVE